jgi:hypothetical protein
MEFDMATVEERKNEKFDEEFNTDRDIANGHNTYRFKEDREDEEYINLKKKGEVPRPMLREGCNLDEFKSFTILWRLYAECNDEMNDRELREQLLRCLDKPLEAAMYDVLGCKLNTIPEADMMEELVKIAV